ncbi:GMC family oxidoreductase [Nostoc sp.]|uniref:GMC family oxidoreductase n=1 Tax=Nostoc sp. TaxID=1180 RepID=UPI002FF93F0B
MRTKHYDVVIVGVGAAGAVFAKQLSQAGLKVLGIEFGKYFQNHRQDFVENEAGVLSLTWNNNQYRVEGDGFSGTPNLGAHVGGGTLAWTSMAFRYFERDFKLKTRYASPLGTAFEDWPITYQDLELYYQIAEQQMGVSGTSLPWYNPRTSPLPNPPHCYFESSKMLEAGMNKLSIRSAPGPVAVNSRMYKNREACINCGFCRSGCRTDAKYQADKVLLPSAFATRNFTLESECVVLKILTEANGTRAKGVIYFDKKTKQTYQANAKIVIVCNNPMETARLFLNSADAKYPNGLGNEYDQVGRYFYAHPSVFGIGFTESKTAIEAGYNMGNIISLDFTETKNPNEYIGGFSLLSLNGSGLGVTAVDPLQNLYGQELKSIQYDYTKFLAMIAFCEGLPKYDNRITVLPQIQDTFGSPVAKISYYFTNHDRIVASKAVAKMRDVMVAAGAVKTYIRENPFESHPMGGMRMGNNPATSVTNEFGQIHSIKNLFVAGASLFPTGSSVGPTLTIHALALRTADYIIKNFRKLS